MWRTRLQWSYLLRLWIHLQVLERVLFPVPLNPLAVGEVVVVVVVVVDLRIVGFDMNPCLSTDLRRAVRMRKQDAIT